MTVAIKLIVMVMTLILAADKKGGNASSKSLSPDSQHTLRLMDD